MMATAAKLPQNGLYVDTNGSGPPQKTASTGLQLPTELERAPFADNPTLGLVPLSATYIFLQRLGAWNNLVKLLCGQFEMIVDHQKRLSEAYGKCARDFAAPIKTRDGMDIFDSAETTQALFRSIQQAHTKQAQEHGEAAAMIETHCLPMLRALQLDLRKKAADTDREWVGLDKELNRDRDTYVKLAAQLRYSLARHHGDPVDSQEKEASVLKDPWTANNNVKKHIAACIHKQDHYRQVLLSQQEHFATYEQSILQTLRLTLSTFFDWQLKDLAAAQDTFKHLKAKLHTLEPVQDWQNFTQRHAARILSRDSPSVAEADVHYDGFDDPLVRSLKEGVLFRRDSGMKFGFRKNWKEMRVVVTEAGYLHSFPIVQSSSNLIPVDSEESKTESEISLYLPDCMIGPLMMNEKEPEEFVIQEKLSGLFGGDKRHKFKGANMDQSATWWGYLSERVRATKNNLDRAAVSPTVSNGTRSTRESMDIKSPAGSTVPNVSVPNSQGQIVDPLTGTVIAQSARRTSRPGPASASAGDPLGVRDSVAHLRRPSIPTTTEITREYAPTAPVAKITISSPTPPSPMSPPVASTIPEPSSPVNELPSNPVHSSFAPAPVPDDGPQLTAAEMMERALNRAVEETNEKVAPSTGFGADPWGSPSDMWGADASLADTFGSTTTTSSLGASMSKAPTLDLDEDLGGSAWT
ncbi:hypothetical protein DFS34DRAFT_624150 [Phlyctochytrium arcticum]|nr:hypothetical protein DFS34DRAFT_624150 [Phlyctochytrium arcticum]